LNFLNKGKEKITFLAKNLIQTPNSVIYKELKLKLYFYGKNKEIEFGLTQKPERTIKIVNEKLFFFAKAKILTL